MLDGSSPWFFSREFVEVHSLRFAGAFCIDSPVHQISLDSIGDRALSFDIAPCRESGRE